MLRIARHAGCRRQGSEARNAAGCSAFGLRGWCLQTTLEGVSAGGRSAKDSRVGNRISVIERPGRLRGFSLWHAGGIECAATLLDGTLRCNVCGTFGLTLSFQTLTVIVLLTIFSCSAACGTLSSVTPGSVQKQ
jgi:hypothetical protein